jgi:hypothetical protein
MDTDQNSAPTNAAQAVAPTRPASKRFADALLIVDPGACNPSGIAYAIAGACREARDEGVSTKDDPAVRLMVTQLAWVCRADSNTDDYGALLAACRDRVAAG